MVLQAIPEDVYDEILRVQGEQKRKLKRRYSLEFAVYKIIKEAIKKDKE